MRKRINTFAAMLVQKKYAHFFLTGVSGILLNMLVTWTLTEFVFGHERYFIGYIIGALVNLTYNFILHSVVTFRTTKDHAQRFVWFMVYSFANWGVQIIIIRMLVSLFGTAFYLPIIAGTILLLSVMSFLFFKYVLFDERGTKRDILHSVSHIFSKDVPVVLAIILLAALLRFVHIDKPDKTMFDEVIYMDYTVMTLEHKPYFDIHPPFAKLLMVAVAKQYDFPYVRPKIEGMQPFGEFPYVPLRSMIASFGVLLTVIIFFIGRALGYTTKEAALPALMVTLDNALILYSRAILPDTILLVMNFAGILFALLAARAVGKKRMGLALLAITLFGCAISIKWTAAGVMMVGLLIFIKKKMWLPILAGCVLLPMIYLGLFTLFVQQFPNGGHIDPVIRSSYDVPWITEASYPDSARLSDSLNFAIDYHQIILRANTDKDVNAGVMRAADPSAWPIARSGIKFWERNDGQTEIQLTGNVLLWLFVFLVLVYECCFVAAKYYRTKQWPIDQTETLLLFGYFMNYVPFFFIARPMYLYHYFAALLFLFLLIPKILPRLSSHLQQVTGNSSFPKQLFVVCIVLVLANFLFFLPLTYGIGFD